MNRTSSNPASMTQKPIAGIASQNQPQNGYLANGEKAVPVPGASYYGNGAERNTGMMGGMPLFDMARSPPSTANKNTKHVPCKFFRQGACQAGSACPFSHSVDPVNQQAPCKYFMKGNCRFGAKCALAHFLPDGRRVNRAELDAGLTGGGRSLNYGRPDPSVYQNSEGLINDPILAQQPYGPDYFSSQGFLLMDPDEPDAFQDRYNQYPNSAALDSGLNSPPTSQFGSPPNDYYLPKSPVDNLRTALNAPLPQSFDVNGVSHIAKYGPLGQSAPDKFGLRSPASSSLSRQLGSPPEMNYGLRGVNPGSNLRNASPLGLSPQNLEESIGQRIMHSQRPSKPRLVSASVPRSNLNEWEEPFGMETDLLPNSLHDEVLTPQEKMRRHSRPDQEMMQREYSSGLAIPNGSTSKVGSPPLSGSPSRFSALWAEQREKKAAAENIMPNMLGHVGSPLRESWMPHEHSESKVLPVSGISQAMARMQINRTESTESNGTRMQLSGLRHSSAPVGRFDRAISSPGLSSKKIEEEGEAGFFPMDDDRRTNSNWPGQSPQLAPLRETPNGDPSRANKEESRFEESGRIKPIFGFGS